MKSATKRVLSASAVFVLVVIGLIAHTGTGTLSSFGWDYIATLCPLGALEAFFGTWAFVPRAAIVLLVMIVGVFIVGKGFCAWACPVPLLQHLFTSKKHKAADEAERAGNAKISLERFESAEKIGRTKGGVDSRHLVLGGALLSVAIFGFPVFCLVCPIGLTFATVIALFRAFRFSDVTWSLLVFPLIVILEVYVLRGWCAKICPLGALFSLIAKGNRTLCPTVDTSKCLRESKGVACSACARVCPELIDPHSDLGINPVSECIRCTRCSEACPEDAISFPFVAHGNDAADIRKQ